MTFLEKFTPFQKGVASLVIGIFLLLDATGVLRISAFFAVIIALILIGYGLFATGLLHKIVGMFKKKGK
jgi:hypothetical protein